jgi:hypothetical protein
MTPGERTHCGIESPPPWLLTARGARYITIDPATSAIQSGNSRFIDGGDWPYATDIAPAPGASAVPEPAS